MLADGKWIIHPNWGVAEAYTHSAIYHWMSLPMALANTWYAFHSQFVWICKVSPVVYSCPSKTVFRFLPFGSGFAVLTLPQVCRSCPNALSGSWCFSSFFYRSKLEGLDQQSFSSYLFPILVFLLYVWAPSLWSSMQWEIMDFVLVSTACILKKFYLHLKSQYFFWS